MIGYLIVENSIIKLSDAKVTGKKVKGFNRNGKLVEGNYDDFFENRSLATRVLENIKKEQNFQETLERYNNNDENYLNFKKAYLEAFKVVEIKQTNYYRFLNLAVLEYNGRIPIKIYFNKINQDIQLNFKAIVKNSEKELTYDSFNLLKTVILIEFGLLKYEQLHLYETYEGWDAVHHNLKTKTQLRKLGLKPVDENIIDGVVKAPFKNKWYEYKLYDVSKAVPINKRLNSQKNKKLKGEKN